jgi:hypothetical protein
MNTVKYYRDGKVTPIRVTQSHGAIRDLVVATEAGAPGRRLPTLREADRHMLGLGYSRKA